MRQKMVPCLMTLLTLCMTATSQANYIPIGDDYARAALRVIIYTQEQGVTAQRISTLLIEADVEASTPSEDASLRELKRIVTNWINHPSGDRQACYLELKASLKARNGKTPEACK